MQQGFFVDAVTIIRLIRGTFFFAAFISSKVKYLPLIGISPWFHIASLICNFIGHSLEYLGSRIEPDHNKHFDEWYGFLEFKEQYGVAASLGIIATLLGVAALFFPPLIIASTWVFLIGNCIKSVGEYHKYQSPPDNDPDYSGKRQKALLNYALTTCVLSLIGAVAVTLIFVFPPSTLYIVIFTTLLGIGFGALSVEFWLDSYFAIQESMEITNSYQTVQAKLNNENDSTYSVNSALQNDFDNTHTPLFAAETMQKTKLETESTPINDNALLCSI